MDDQSWYRYCLEILTEVCFGERGHAGERCGLAGLEGEGEGLLTLLFGDFEYSVDGVKLSDEVVVKFFLARGEPCGHLLG